MFVSFSFGKNSLSANLLLWLILIFACLSLPSCRKNTLSPILVLEGHNYNTVYADFPNNDRIITRSSDGDAKIWDSHSGQAVNLIQGPFNNLSLKTVSLSFSKDGETALLWPMEHPSKLLWDVRSGQQKGTFPEDASWIRQAIFLNNDNDIAAITDQGKSVKIWNIDTGQLVQNISSKGQDLRFIKANPDGNKIIATTRSAGFGRGFIWDVKRGTKMSTAWPSSDLVFSQDYSKVIAMNAHRDHGKKKFEVKVYDVKSGDLLAEQTLQDHSYPFVFSTDNDTIAYGVRGSTKGGIYLWRYKTGETLGPFANEDSYSLGKFFFSPDGNALMSANKSGLKIWNKTTGDEIKHVKGAMKPATSYKYSRDGTRLLIESKWHVGGFSDGIYYYLWDMENFRLLGKYKSKLKQGGAAQFSPDETQILLLPGNRTARLLDIKTGNQIATLKGHRRKVMSASFAPDSQRLVTGSRDRTAMVWDIGKESSTKTSRAEGPS